MIRKIIVWRCTECGRTKTWEKIYPVVGYCEHCKKEMKVVSVRETDIGEPNGN